MVSRAVEFSVDLPASTSIEDFVAEPVGRCVLGATYLVWCATPRLQGVILWGTLDDASLRDLIEINQFIHHPAVATQRRELIDCREVTRVDADAMLGFTALARERVPAWAATIERQAIIVPAGLPGLLVAGALPSAGASHLMRFVHDLDAALAFVDHPGARAAHAMAARIAMANRGPAVLIARLRGQLGRDLAGATLEGAAGALGMSGRTLQRELARLGTSFSDELRRARVAAAEALLLHSDLKIDAIAVEVGFGSASRMSAALRRELDATASDLRARSRG